MPMGDGHFAGTSFLGGPTGEYQPTHPPSNSFAPKLGPDHYHSQSIIPDQFNFPNFSHDFLSGLSFDQNQDLIFPTAAEVNKELPPISDPQAQNQPKRKRAAVPEIEDPRERKKMTDKRYREKVKTEKEQVKQQLDELKGENGSLIQEIEQLRGENATMIQTMESSSEHIRELSTSHNQLKREFTRQESFVQALLSKLTPENEMMMKQKQESQMLRVVEEAVLRQDMKEVVHMCEELLNENMKLKREKMILEVKVEALCEKIHNDKHQK